MAKKTLAALAACAMSAVFVTPATAQDVSNATVTPDMSSEAIMRDALTNLDGYERYTFLKMLQILPANEADLVVTIVRNCHRHAWDTAYASWSRTNTGAAGTDAMANRTMRKSWSPWLKSNTMNIERHMLDRLTTMERRQAGDMWTRLTESERDVIREMVHNCMTMYGMESEIER